MITHTLLNKCNTIIENSEINTGLNPVAELNIGKVLTRILVSCDLSSLKKTVIEDGIDTKYLKHTLKMTNCGNINLPLSNDVLCIDCDVKKRASSFEVIAFKIPFLWDEGRGFDYHGDYVKESHKVISTDASNWFQARNGMEWDEHGVFFYDTLKNDLETKYNVTNDSVIVGIQHFDNGTENLEIDVTDYINEMLVSKHDFYGIGLAFAPKYETDTVNNKFISFFTNHTNTFFHPYIETINENVICDNRANFHIGCNNKLYFFSYDNGKPINLDEKPICTINGNVYEVKQSCRGAYYVDVFLSKNEIEPETILYDIWSNIKLNGELLDDVEMEFVAHPMSNKVTIGKYTNNHISLYPQLSGINDKENLKIGDVREVVVDFIEEFSYGKKNIPQEAYFKVYVKENNREIDVFKYHPLERKYDEHAFVVNTNEMIPNTYYVDIKIVNGKNIKHFNNVLEFSIISNVSNLYK